MLSEPSRAWQDQQHQRILRNDAIAFAELSELALPHLVSFLKATFPQSESALTEMVAIDCLLAYQARPNQYDPSQLTLFAYFRMAARRDVLNAIDKKTRHEQRLFDIDDPAIQSQLPEQDIIGETFDEWLQDYTHLSRQEILDAFEAELEATDRQLLSLMLNGVRDTGAYAEVMGIADQTLSVQRREVKRAKDRLTKKLQRFGQRLDRI
jgi:hypothetical protein